MGVGGMAEISVAVSCRRRAVLERARRLGLVSRASRGIKSSADYHLVDCEVGLEERATAARAKGREYLRREAIPSGGSTDVDVEVKST